MKIVQRRQQFMKKKMTLKMKRQLVRQHKQEQVVIH